MTRYDEVELQINEMPTHNHQVAASGEDAVSAKPAGRFLANTGSVSAYTDTSDETVMAADMILPTGGSEPHENIPPYLALNFCIALQGTLRRL
jgi:microcystin-dependent protein